MLFVRRHPSNASLFYYAAPEYTVDLIELLKANFLLNSIMGANPQVLGFYLKTCSDKFRTLLN